MKITALWLQFDVTLSRLHVSERRFPMSSPTQTHPVPTLKNILFATDFSACSLAAQPYLRSIAEHYGSTVHVVHVLPPEPMIELSLDLPPELDTDQEAAQAALKTLLSGEPFGKIACTSSVVRGPLWDVLATFIEEKNIDLVVVGTHGRRGLKKLVMGSVAERVFRHARCPVLTVGPQTESEGGARTGIATILFATDFSAGSQHALPYAVSLARANGAHLILLHSVSVSLEVASVDITVGPSIAEIPEELIAEALTSARKQTAELVSAGNMQDLKPQVIVEAGLSAETILSVAKEKRADLIVMGAHRAPGGASHLPWATASAVVCGAHCPVLTVRN
jgi:nucleotide-binding universal stress UspA family protein